MDCPICQTSNIPESNKFCPTCGYDISPDPLDTEGIPQALIEKEQQRIAWAKKLWADSRAKIAQPKAASTQSRYQINQIVSQVEELTKVQTQLSHQLAELASVNMSARLSEIEQRLEQRLEGIVTSRLASDKMSARFSEIEQQLEQRLEEIVDSELADLSANVETIEQKITDQLKKSLSEEMSTAVSQLEQRLDSLVTVFLQAVKSAPSQPSAPDTKISLHTFSFTTKKMSDGTISSERAQAKYFWEDIGNGVTLDMVAIPGGTFIMGSPETEKKRYDREGPQHLVTVPAFFMARYPVTQAQWQAVMGNNPSRFQGLNRPVEQVSWDDAVEFCQKLSAKTGRDYRLPSEAEWEYACRAGTTTPFYFGETMTTDLANYNGTETYGNELRGKCGRETTDVGIFPPNAFGLYDMHGNVSEWCANYWHDNYKGAPTDGSAWTSGEDSGRRVLRGGDWCSNPRNCRSACRGYGIPDSLIDSNCIGFRIAVSLPN